MDGHRLVCCHRLSVEIGDVKTSCGVGKRTYTIRTVRLERCNIGVHTSKEAPEDSVYVKAM